MLKATEYGVLEMPELKAVLAEIAATPGRICVHIYSGAPRYWFGRRQIKRVHGKIRYRNGKEAFRSKSVTDGVLAMKVARTVVPEGRDAIDVFVFSPYGHKKERDCRYDPDTGTRRWTVAEPKDFIKIPPELDDDELPF